MMEQVRCPRVVLFLVRVLVAMFALCALMLSAVHASAANDRGASWAVVTGASSGIGAAAARQAAARGFHVLLAARRPEQLRAASSVDITSATYSWPHITSAPAAQSRLELGQGPCTAWPVCPRLYGMPTCSATSAAARLQRSTLCMLLPPPSMRAGGGRRDSRLQLRRARRDRAVRPGPRDRRRHALCCRREARRHAGGANLLSTEQNRTEQN